PASRGGRRRAGTGARGVLGVALAYPQVGGDAVDPGVVLSGASVAVRGGRPAQSGRVAFGVPQLVRVAEQPTVQLAALLELGVGADIHQPPTVEDGDAVGQGEGGAAVGDQQGGAAGHHAAQRLVDLVLDTGVHSGGGVVQDEQTGVGE